PEGVSTLGVPAFTEDPEGVSTLGVPAFTEDPEGVSTLGVPAFGGPRGRSWPVPRFPAPLRGPAVGGRPLPGVPRTTRG
ncbi:hypothetical protein RM704_37785, partial [Streptomyces sp. DSM 3412]